MSFALLEAMGYGLAILAADGPGNPEAVGDAGLLFATGDQAALIEAMTQLGSEPGLRASLGASASARMRDQFSPARFLDATKAVYLQSLKTP
jgi:glycosyltransferase involved in cell wall biosynthesis